MATPLFCFSCSSIQRLNSSPNYFEVFDIPYEYDLDLEKLEQEYNRLASELHPDFYLMASSFEKKQSVESAALLNQAYQNIKNPFSRAQYLLKILTHGKPLDSRALSPGFLEKMFELQEKLDHWLASSQYQQQVQEFADSLQQQITEYPLQFKRFFVDINNHPEDMSRYNAVQCSLNEVHYLQRLLDRISVHQAA